MHTQTIAISSLRSHLLTYLKQAEHGEELLITSKGHTIARILPPKDTTKDAKKALNQLRTKSKIGDVISSIETEWEANN